MPFNTPQDPNVPAVADSVDVALERARQKAKKERNIRIGSLLDSASDVLEEILQTTDPAHASQRMRAAEVAINLYIQSENSERQDKLIEVQTRRLELEEAKLRSQGNPVFTQNNLYIGEQKQKVPESPEEQAANLLARKQMQEQLLASFLPQQRKDIEEVEPVPVSVAGSDSTGGQN